MSKYKIGETDDWDFRFHTTKFSAEPADRVFDIVTGLLK
jgi:hypothetical protein